MAWVLDLSERELRGTIAGLALTAAILVLTARHLSRTTLTP